MSDTLFLWDLFGYHMHITLLDVMFSGIILFGVILALIGCCHRTCHCICCPGDNDKYHLWLYGSIRINDLITDIFVSYYMWKYYFSLENTIDFNIKSPYFKLLILCISSTTFIIIPYILNLIYCYIIICGKQSQTWANKSRVHSYFYRYSMVFIILILLTSDTYLSIEITSSNYLSLAIFDSGITIFDLQHKKHIKVLAVLLMEVKRIYGIYTYINNVIIHRIYQN